MPLVLLLKGGGLNNKHDLKKAKKTYELLFLQQIFKKYFFLKFKTNP